MYYGVVSMSGSVSVLRVSEEEIGMIEYQGRVKIPLGFNGQIKIDL